MYQYCSCIICYTTNNIIIVWGFLSMYSNDYGNNIILYYIISIVGSFFMWYFKSIQ